MGKFADELAPKFADSTEPTLADYKSHTIAWLIQRYIEEMAQPDMAPLGDSKIYTLRLMGRKPIGAKLASALTKADIITYCRERKRQYVRNTKRFVTTATINQEISYLAVVLNYAGSGAPGWDDCADISASVILASKPYLKKHGLIGKAMRRKRRPSDEEIHKLLDFFAKQKLNPRTKIDMAQILAFALVSTRRLGEICRITHGDVDRARKVYTVRDVKHPTKKKGNDKEFPLFPELAEIIDRQPRLTDDPAERVFPYNSKCASQNYADAKTKLGIVGLRFHDNRREAITRWLKLLPPHKVRKISGHDASSNVLETVYDGTTAADLGAEIATLIERRDANKGETHVR